MSAVDRAVEIIERNVECGHEHADRFIYDDGAAQVLAYAGLLVTDEIQAVLDAAVKWNSWADREWTDDHAALMCAVDAYIASRQQ